MSGSISGRYFCDLNDNDLDDGEPGIEGVRVTLVNPDGTPALDQNGDPVAGVLTDAQGRYSFPNLAPGTYDIVFDDPDGVLTGKTLITPNVNSNAEDDRDSDATGSGAGIIQGIVVVAEETTPDNDVGAENILTPITGRVFDDRNCDGVFDEGDAFYEGLRIELLDEQGTLLASANSNFEGFFTLSSVPFGTYSIRAVAPSGYVFTLQDQGTDDSRDSDISALGTIGPFSVSAEEGLDFGVGLCEQTTGAISGRYFCDENRDDTEDDGTGAGLDVGVADKAVTLFDADGAEVASTRTRSDGTYLFEGLDPGDYVVQFEDSLADGKAFVAPDAGDDATDSDVDPATGRTGPVTVTSGKTTLNVDAGVADMPASIGGRYFCDENDDALEGSTEPGIAGVTIQLFNSDGTTAVDIDGNAVSPVQTGADGSYLFTNLKAGTYVVSITDTSLPLSGKTLVAPNVGNNDSIDSDAIAVTSFAAQIPDISVRAGQASTDNDAGIRYQTGTIGGTVFCDTDCDGLAQDEPVKEGVTIQLLDAHGAVLDQMRTGPDGGYQFDAVPIGAYSILATAPDGTQFTIRDANGDTMDDIDSDVDATGSSGIFGVVDRAVLDIDIGLCDLPGAISGRYFCDENRDDTEDDGTGTGLDVGVAGKTVTLYDANGGFVASTMTQTDGR